MTFFTGEIGEKGFAEGGAVYGHDGQIISVAIRIHDIDGIERLIPGNNLARARAQRHLNEKRKYRIEPVADWNDTRPYLDEYDMGPERESVEDR